MVLYWAAAALRRGLLRPYPAGIPQRQTPADARRRGENGRWAHSHPPNAQMAIGLFARYYNNQSMMRHQISAFYSKK